LFRQAHFDTGDISMSENKNPRRSLLKGAALAAGAVSAPMVARAQSPVTFRFQSTWPAKDIFHEYALDFSKKVNDMAGGRLRIDVLPAGAVVPAFQLLDAVAKGTLDGGHGVVAYWYGKNPAVALWGSGPAYGMDANMLLSWHYYGGGKQLLEDIYKELNLPVQSFLYGPMPTQPLGWFKKPVSKAEEMKGLKFRTVGLAVDVFTEMGVAVNPLPGGEIIPALDRGLLDAASSTMRRAIASLASQTYPRTACSRAFTSRASSLKSCSTNRSTTRSRRT
jgi:TRAP-type mannitol/chloroaromatic compound transport system substrate-binding protein